MCVCACAHGACVCARARCVSLSVRTVCPCICLCACVPAGRCLLCLVGPSTWAMSEQCSVCVPAFAACVCACLYKSPPWLLPRELGFHILSFHSEGCRLQRISSTATRCKSPYFEALNSHRTLSTGDTRCGSGNTWYSCLSRYSGGSAIGGSCCFHQEEAAAHCWQAEMKFGTLGFKSQLILEPKQYK